jgi:hypothetical protein
VAGKSRNAAGEGDGLGGRDSVMELVFDQQEADDVAVEFRSA